MDLNAPLSSITSEGLDLALSHIRSRAPDVNIRDVEDHRSDLDREIDLLLSLSAEISLRVSRFRQARYHTISKIGALPVEIVVSIFDYLACRAEEVWNYPRGLHTLAQVCKRWAEIVKGTPEFWTVLDIEMSKPDMVVALTLSQPLPLDVYFVPTLNVWPLFTGSMHRWKDADITVASRKTLKALGRRNGAPLLEQLLLEWTDPGNSPRQLAVKLFDGLAPSLRHLSLCRVALEDWQAPFLRNLLSLSIKQINYPGSLQTFVDVLKGCHELRKLVLADTTFATESLALATPPIHLPELQSLSLFILAPTVTMGLLDVMGIPRCTSLHVSHELFGSSSLLRDVSSSVAPMFRFCLKGYLTAGLGDIVCEMGDFLQLRLPFAPSPRFSLVVMSSVPFPEALEMWTDVFALRALPLTLVITDYRPGVEPGLANIAASLWGLSGVMRLCLRRCGDELNPILRELASPTEHVDGRKEWRLPNLSEMDIEGRRGLSVELMVHMVKARMKAAQSYGGPVPFKQFTFRAAELGVDTVPELDEVLGDSFRMLSDGSSFNALE